MILVDLEGSRAESVGGGQKGTGTETGKNGFFQTRKSFNRGRTG